MKEPFRKYFTARWAGARKRPGGAIQIVAFDGDGNEITIRLTKEQAEDLGVELTLSACKTRMTNQEDEAWRAHVAAMRTRYVK